MAVSEESTAPKSMHVSDPTLAPFLQPQFDPAHYLNAALPSLSLSSVSSRPLKQGNSVSLADLSSQTQDLLSQLNAHTTRLSAVLTQLTDDILRSGARLAYEVEVLRGETVGLTETLTEGVKGDIEKFLPGGISLEAKVADRETSSEEEDTERGTDDDVAEKKDETTKPTDQTPSYITELQTLTQIRNRLDTVIKVFGEAMHWTLPPSETLTSSLISVSAPEADSTLEAKGKEFAASLRAEIADLITGDPENGMEAAGLRIQALRELAVVWKGTAEEKARAKFVEGLVRLAEEKMKVVEAERERERKGRTGRSGSLPKERVAPPVPQRSGGGFLDNLQRIRENYIQ
ncbi:hypothetical protein K458DRAFT_413066 [Lentithecium fluviatile CBS 122367]|uniref:Uncharacterized protein n=1 Tax=Lentithecium fluviatile CBS 122367 TaxID=1168545 RepID=A0A6G1JJC7_9PLEO|nr:hypothetical protein K458DRAFT_413066 [Lentithecium fluviatile CBS 122367]